MTRTDLEHERRRIFVLRALAAGLFAAAGPSMAALLGHLPKPMPAGKSIFLLQGLVTVNGATATSDTAIRAGDRIETAPNSRVIFVVGQDAFILREASTLQLEPAPAEFVVETLRLVTGKLLSVFGKTRHAVYTPTATIGIRGTGLYVEADAEQSYVCTCYGTTEVSANDDPSAIETIQSRHHDAARYVLAASAKGPHLRAAPFINHTDDELGVVEALVGRTPPFVLPGDSYSSPRRSEY